MPVKFNASLPRRLPHRRLITYFLQLGVLTVYCSTSSATAQLIENKSSIIARIDRQQLVFINYALYLSLMKAAMSLAKIISQKFKISNATAKKFRSSIPALRFL